MTHYYIILQLIKSLQAEVTLLESELAAQNIQVQTTTPIVFPTYIPPRQSTSTEQSTTVQTTTQQVATTTLITLQQNSNFSTVTVQELQDKSEVIVTFMRPDSGLGQDLGYILLGTFTINGQTLTMDNWKNGHIDFAPQDLGLTIGQSYDYTWHAENDTYESDGQGTFIP
jgi:hypothetical protein